MIDLQPFCGEDPCRPYVHQPFARGAFTYATNGHIMVRVPHADAPVKDRADEINPEAVFEKAGLDGATFTRPRAVLPEKPEGEGPCPRCEGRGFLHDCVDCTCVCMLCRGSGNVNLERVTSTELGGRIFNLSYIRQVLALPNVEISQATSLSDKGPLLFRFDGGVGALMPMTSPYADHIQIEVQG